VTETVRDSGISGFFGGTHTETHTISVVQFFNDTWEYDGAVWTRVGDTGPDPRAGVALVHNGKTTILFGGQQNNTLFKDTWEWDGKHWTQRQDMGPAARGFAGIAFYASRERVVLFGGAAGSTAFADTWELSMRKVEAGQPE
jgi:N-acetylneuraminic acid mutarotase